MNTSYRLRSLGVLLDVVAHLMTAVGMICLGLSFAVMGIRHAWPIAAATTTLLIALQLVLSVALLPLFAVLGLVFWSSLKSFVSQWKLLQAHLCIKDEGLVVTRNDRIRDIIRWHDVQQFLSAPRQFHRLRYMRKGHSAQLVLGRHMFRADEFQTIGKEIEAHLPKPDREASLA